LLAVRSHIRLAVPLIDSAEVRKVAHVVQLRVAGSSPDVRSLPSDAPGLVLVAPNDVFGDVMMQQDFAAAAGAKTEELDSLDHWWMLEDAELAATVLERFWATV
jgi:hypothetical protein